MAGDPVAAEASLQPFWEVVAMIPPDLILPWHRVLGAGGRIVFPSSSSQYREQSRRLRAEGVRVQNGRVDPAALWDG